MQYMQMVIRRSQRTSFGYWMWPVLVMKHPFLTASIVEQKKIVVQWERYLLLNAL